MEMEIPSIALPGLDPRKVLANILRFVAAIHSQIQVSDLTVSSNVYTEHLT